MESKKTPLNIIQKITNFLIGFIFSFFLMAIALKLLPNIWGLMIGCVISIAASIFLLKKRKTPYKKQIAKGMLSSGLLILVLAGIFLLLFSTSLQNALN